MLCIKPNFHLTYLSHSRFLLTISKSNFQNCKFLTHLFRIFLIQRALMWRHFKGGSVLTEYFKALLFKKSPGCKSEARTAQGWNFRLFKFPFQNFRLFKFPESKNFREIGAETQPAYHSQIGESWADCQRVVPNWTRPNLTPDFAQY